MLSEVMLSVIILSVITLSAIMMKVFVLCVIMLSVVVLITIMLSVIMLNVVMLSVIMLNIVMLSVVAPEDDAIKNLLTLFAKLDPSIVVSTLFFFFKTDQLAKQIYSLKKL
jgi:hypothetical protein